MAATMLSTSDNPFNPFTQYEAWLEYDEAHGYDSNRYLAKIAIVSDSLSNAEIETEIERAIDEIVEINPLGIHIKVTENDKRFDSTP
jgi:hypothetical protein